MLTAKTFAPLDGTLTYRHRRNYHFFSLRDNSRTQLLYKAFDYEQ
ncbi:hypothetical protein [Pedobacter gandavensis]|nr:hypothetical protein [Pedobacter gandavensis]